MRIIVVGLGVQGAKRRYHAANDFLASVDTLNPEADYVSVYDVPLEAFDAALVCLPDQPKYDVLKYLLQNKKHVLVEKPLWTESLTQIHELETIANQHGLVCYTAYNHRFEPHFVRMKSLIDSGTLGQIYHCRLFYGNGTARLVRDSAWRDEGLGVITDLMPHLYDISAYWFGAVTSDFCLVEANRFENRAFDHAVMQNAAHHPCLTFEMSLLSWRNHFTCDVIAEKGSAHIESLCKWGPSTFTHRQRVLPSGRPPEESVTVTQSDPTWDIEYQAFKQRIQDQVQTDLSVDKSILSQLKKFDAVLQGVAA